MGCVLGVLNVLLSYILAGGGAIPKMAKVTWTDESVNIFLDVCGNHRTVLRQPTVTLGFWNSVAQEVSQLAFSCHGEQLRDKFKYLKRQYKRMKEHRRESAELLWSHFTKMKFILDEAILTCAHRCLVFYLRYDTVSFILT